MSQIAVTDQPAQMYEGMLDNGGTSANTKSLAANELIYFGKAVLPLNDTDLVVGGAAGGPQLAKLTVTGLVGFEQAGGIAVADPSRERLSLNGAPAPYGAYVATEMVTVLRRGAIWVVTEIALTALSNVVYVRVSTPGGSPPAASLGSFTNTNSVDHEALPNAKWTGSAVHNGVDFGRLELNLP